MSVTISQSLCPAEAIAHVDMHIARPAAGAAVRGQWRGRAASRMGLAGAADPIDIRNLASGEDPTAPGSKLEWIAGRGVAGWRLVITAPRSVGILGLQGPDPDLVAAHDSAVDRALVAAEEAVRASLNSMLTRSLVAVVFPHRYELAGDPLLESRIFLFNITSVPGSATPLSLEYTVPYEVREIVEATYDTELRGLVRALGYDVVRTGVTAFEITGAGEVALDRGAPDPPWIEDGRDADRDDQAAPESSGPTRVVAAARDRRLAGAP